MSKLIIISGASGSGKSSLVKGLHKILPEITLSISYTTRAIRAYEQPDVDYHFITTAYFKQALKDEQFIEYAQVFDHYYGTKRSDLEQQLKQESEVILEIDWQGAKQIQRVFTDALRIFIMPPTIEALKTRLNVRKENAAVVKRRMQDAKAESGHYLQYQYIIINHNFATALDELKSIIIANRLRLHNQSANIKKILNNA